MSFFDDASLAFLPSGAAGKDTKAYSIKPTDGSGDFTFSRGSNLAATRVGPTGLIEKGRENLLLRSNQFNTTWNYSNNTLVSGQSGYDGSNNAWLVTKVPSSYVPITQSVSVSGVNTFSFYAKAGTAAFVRTYIPSGGWIINFDFASGNATNQATTNGLVSYSMTSVGNGWYRCSSTHSGSITDVRIYNEWAQTNATTYYVQDAQLEIGLAATEVITTGATTGKAGLLEDEPRFDYSGGATCPSLLLEPSRTNLIGYSEYFGDSYWTNSGTSVVSGFTSPEGLSNAYKLVEDSNNSRHFINSSGIVTPDTTYSSSVYIKPNDRNKVALRENSITGHYASFDLSDGTLIETTGVSASIESVSNGWYRIDYQVTSGPSYILGIYLLSDSYTSGDPYSNPYQGDGTSGVYIYGAQTEIGSYPTSYIPNHSGGSVTRGRDECTGAGDVNTFNSTEGVLYAEINALKYPVDVNNWLTITDGTNANSVAIQFETNGTLSGRIEVGGVSQAYITTSVDYSNFIKVAFKYKENDFAWWVNGVEVGTDSSGITFPSNTLNSLQFAYGSGGNNWAGNVKQVLVFKEALSDTELIKLTTI